MAMIESSASSELYALLKRQDEKAVTERAYENPVFVEDLVRNVALQAERASAGDAGIRSRRKISRASTITMPTRALKRADVVQNFPKILVAYLVAFATFPRS